MTAGRDPADPSIPDVHTIVVGAGFSGIGMAIQLDRAGLGAYRRSPTSSRSSRARTGRPSCQLANSHYFDENGDVPLRPTTTVEAAWPGNRFPLADYAFTG